MSLQEHKETNSDYPEYLLAENQQATDANVGLFNAALAGSVSGVENWLAKGAKPNFFFRPQDQKNALHIAAENNYLDIVDALLKNGAEINCIASTDQTTALVLASHHGDPKMVQLLISSGANVNHENGYGNTALHEACHYGHFEAAQALLQAGASIRNKPNHKGSTALHIFCLGEDSKTHTKALMNLLVDAGADLDAVDKRGATPLLICCASGRVDLMDILLSNGANLDATDMNNQNALDVAIFYNQAEAVKFLQAKGLQAHK